MICEKFGGPEPPFIPGGETAGHVVAAGSDVSDFAIGDAVMSRHTLGALAELGNARPALCDKVPAGLSMAQAGVFRGAYTTACHALLQRGRLAAGEWVLVHGARRTGAPSPGWPAHTPNLYQGHRRRIAVLRGEPRFARSAEPA